MKKVFSLIVFLLIATLLAVGCGKSGGSANTPGDSKQAAGIEAKEIRVATQPVPQYAPIFVAEKKGWLEEDLAKVGVTVKWSSFASGPPMNESFAAGEQDVGLLGDSAAIIPKSAGQDTRIIGIASASPTALAVVLPKDSKITSPKELKGKKVAVVKGSYAHHLLALVLQNNGLTTNDIQFINMQQPDIATALAKGDIDAGAIWEPLITQLTDQGVIRVLADGTGIKKGLLVIVATQDFATKNPELVKILLKNYQRGYEFIKANPEEAAKLIADDVKLNPEQLTKVLAKIDFAPGLHADDIEELKKSEEFMRNVDIIKTPVDIDKFVDNSYAQSAGIQ